MTFHRVTILDGVSSLWGDLCEVVMPKNNSLNTTFTPPVSKSTHAQSLFDLNNYLLIDIPSCLKNMHADQASFLSILNTLLTEEFPNEKAEYLQAHTQADWEKIEKLAHKMKGGAIYTGLVRLQYACQHYENAYQHGKTDLFEALYQQIIHVMQETQVELERLLAAQHWK